ncbi:unnamed protein product [Durusdinium trenchii]|uniref:Uncharacterized protein n=1 Tax=Durusdinium trenchii TaxID=1381693 RepID=A0ABP0LN65_9DINO|eukprot:g13919.t1
MRLSVEAAYGWPCTKLRHPLHPTVFKQGDVGIHLHVQYDPVKEMVLEAKTYTVPNLDDEPPPPSGEVLQKIEAMASEAMSENGACRQKMSQVNLALRDAPKLPQDLFGPVESGFSQYVLAIFRFSEPMVVRSISVQAKHPSRLSNFL